MRIYILCLFFLLSAGNSFSQYSSEVSFKRFIKNTGNVLISPLDYNNQDLLKVGAYITGSFILMQFDESINDFLVNSNEYSESFPVEAARVYGEPLFSILTAGLLGISGATSGNDYNIQTSFMMVESFTASVTAVGAIKYSLGRMRPRDNTEAHSFSPFSFKGDDYLSFPSGHTAIAFSLSTVLSARLNSEFLKAFVYLPAVLTGFSRMYQSHHWMSDVFFGAVLGYSIGRYISSQKETPANSIEPAGVHKNIFNISLCF